MKEVNNAFYDTLKEDWYQRDDHPIALLRQENKVRNPWIEKVLEEHFSSKQLTVLDIGCGAGFLTNFLSKSHQVFGIDLSESSLEIAKKFDETASVNYQIQNAMNLQFSDQSFDAVFAMDLLEHVENPQNVIKEASRILKPGGLFFFHTFNRNLLSYLLIIKGVDFFVPNAPKDMHLFSHFIKPSELEGFLLTENLRPKILLGLEPKIPSFGIFDLLFKKIISNRFTFKISRSLKTGYMGYAIKQ